MNRRLLVILCAGLALVLGIVFWTTTSTPNPTQGPVRQGSASEQQVLPNQAQSPALADGADRADRQFDSANSPATVQCDEDSANPITAAAEQPSTSDNASSEHSTIARTQDQAAVPVLSEHVIAVIEAVQKKQLDGQWEESLTDLNALYADYEKLNSFEQTTLLNFYTNTLLRFEMWQEAIGAFSRMLTIPDLRSDLGVRALMALGQLHARVGEYAASITYLTSWQIMTTGMENMEHSNARVEQLLAQSRDALQQTTLGDQ